MTASATKKQSAKQSEQHSDEATISDFDAAEWVQDHPVSATLMGLAAGFAAGSGLGSHAVTLAKSAVKSEQGKRVVATVYPMARAAVISYLKQEIQRFVPGLKA